MSSSARRRLVMDYNRIRKEASAYVTASPLVDNIMIWNAAIIGPVDTPFEDGTFNLVMEFGEQYPTRPPTVKFVTWIFHPNVYYKRGDICVDILQTNWSPTYDVFSLLTSIQSLLNDPNTSSPATPLAAQIYTENRTLYNKIVKEFSHFSWSKHSERTLEGHNDQAEDRQEPSDDEEEVSNDDKGSENAPPKRRKYKHPDDILKDYIPGFRSEAMS